MNASSQQMRLKQAIETLQNDEQFTHAVISLYVTDTAGKIIFDHNSKFGLVPASAQKILTSISAFEMLGQHYRFKTYVSSDGERFIVTGNGDPTLGSTRWAATNPTAVLDKLRSIYRRSGSPKKIYIDDMRYGLQVLPDGWVWQDIGNYYGAGVWGLNWMENSYQVYLKSSEEGLPVTVLSTNPPVYRNEIINLIVSSKKGSGDNAYLYAAPYSGLIYATGTIPAGENNFRIAGAMPHPARQFGIDLLRHIGQEKIPLGIYSDFFRSNKEYPPRTKIIDSLISPSFDSMNYWFMEKSINLYGEAFVKAIAGKEGKTGTGMGIESIKNFWSSRMDIDAGVMNIIDGSGLSPSNRITTKLLVDLLQYAKDRPWFRSFYSSLPDMNGMKMKSGYMTGVRAYSGYAKNKKGETFTFAFFVNNFTGSPSKAREKIWKVLDHLK